MNSLKTHYMYSFLIAVIVAAFVQPNMAQSTLAPPTNSNFAYPQSIYIDSYNGHIWVTDFSNHRVMRFDVSTLTSGEELYLSSFPSSYFLAQNYPNPFNSITNISFYTQSGGHVVLTVYNLLGEKISTLFNNIADANTVYTVQFFAKDLPSGVYMYSLHTHEKIEIKKMCLLN